MKNKYKILILFIVVLLLAFAVYSTWEELTQLKFVNPYLIMTLVFLNLINLYLTGYLNRDLYSALELHITKKEAFMLSTISGFYNLITFLRGGMAVKAVYLKKKYSFNYSKFIATLAASYLLIFLASSLLGIISILIIYYHSMVLSWEILSALGFIFLICLVIITFSPTFSQPKNKWVNSFVKVINSWHYIKNNKRIILSVTIVSIIQTLISAIMMYLQFKVFGIEISGAVSLFLAATASLGIIAITPGGLGIQEAITVFSAATIGITPAASLSAALLGRAVSLVVLFVLGPIFSYVLMKKNPEDKK